MNQFSSLPNKTPLIWLVSFAILFSTGVFNYGNISRIPLRHYKQTELTLKVYNQKHQKKSLSVFTDIVAKHNIRFNNDLSFLTRISWHSNTHFLIWKMCGKHLLSPTIKIVHTSLAYTTDEDLHLVKG